MVLLPATDWRYFRELKEMATQQEKGTVLRLGVCQRTRLYPTRTKESLNCRKAFLKWSRQLMHMCYVKSGRSLNTGWMYAVLAF
jgi:hypothetical protein